MKILNRSFIGILSFAFIFLFTACQQEEININEKTGIQFSLMPDAVSDAENGRIADQHLPPTVMPGMCDLENAAYAMVEINEGDSYTLDIKKWGESHKTNLLELDPGDYQVTKFVVYDENDVALFATPTTGSTFEKFVGMPLPMNFSVQNYEKLEEDVEVLCVENFSPPEFGFSFWDIDLKQTKQLCIFANYCDPEEGHNVAAIQAYVFPDEEENEEQLIYEASSEGSGDLLCLRMPFDPDVELNEQSYWVVVMVNQEKYAGWINLEMVENINGENGYLHLNENCEGDYSPFVKEFTVTLTNVFEPELFFLAGVYDTPVDANEPGVALPGQSYEFEFYAAEGHLLSTVLMYVQSNDLYFATPPNGLPVFNEDGTAKSGDITEYFTLYDAGTEVNQEPGVGPDQAPRQSGPDTGEDENGVIQPISEVDDGFTYPDVDDAIEVILTPGAGNKFSLTINNISDDTEHPSPLSPGAWVVHGDDVQLFEVGEEAGEGLEDIAEDGDPTVLGTFLIENSGLVSPFSPGVFAIHDGDVMPFFIEGDPALGNGLEELAEDGMPGILNTHLSMAPGVHQHGLVAPDPIGLILPGESISFSFYANGGAYLNLATMLVQTNDLFFAFDDMGLPLFDEAGNPKTGDVTPYIQLWDAGTEVDQFPGAGPDQAPRQAGTDTGADENGNVVVVTEDDEFDYPAVNEMIQIVID